MTSTITYHLGDVRDVMAAMPDASVDLVVTSPPFLALRSYLPADHPDKHREIGSESTPAGFLDTMLGLTADWRRLLAPHGSICVEIGDTYSGTAMSGQRYDEWNGSPESYDGRGRDKQGPGWPLAKSLCGIPTLYTWSLAYGRNLLTGNASPAGSWRIRNLLTWTRPNPPVGALGDKFRPATSFVTVACVGARRWFDLDAVRGPGSPNTHARTAKGIERRISSGKRGDPGRGGGWATLDEVHDTNGAPPLDWWDANDLPDELLAEHWELAAELDRLVAEWQPLHRLPTSPYKGSHFATFPVALPERLIKAMCPAEVCSSCGTPRNRLVAKTAEYAAARAAIGDFKADRGRDAGLNGTTQYHNGKHMESAGHVTLGWSLCSCESPEHVPGVVLDPFGGSGTTAVAAALHGRNATLVDLDPRNLHLARQRIGDTLRIVSELHDGDTVTFTVETRLPNQRTQVAGQTNLFDFDGDAA